MQDPARDPAPADLSVRVGDDDGVPVRPESWAWELENPLGPRVRVAGDGRGPLARVATRPVRVLADGEVKVFGCWLAPWTAPGPGLAGDEPSPALLAAARSLVEETTGVDRDLLTYGWPRAEHEVWLQRELRFEIVRVHTVLVEEAARAGQGPGLPAGVVELPAPDPATEALHARCARHHGVSGLRDEAFLRWRVGAHPERPYRVLAVRGAEGALLGQAILRRSDALGAEATTVVDWLVPEDEPEVGLALLEGLRAVARAQGAGELRATFPEWSAWHVRLQDAGLLVVASDLRLAIRRNHPRHEVYWLRDHWWLQPLDLDRA